MNVIHPPITQDELEAQRRRNAERIQAAKAALGARHLTHPANALKRRSDAK